MRLLKTPVLLFALFLFFHTHLLSQGIDLTVSPSSQTVNLGNTAIFNPSITPSGGFSQQVFFSVTGTDLPPLEYTALFTPSSIFSPYTTVVDLEVYISGGVPPGNYFVAIKAENGPVGDADTCYITVLPDTCNFYTIPGYDPGYAGRMLFDNLGNLWAITSISGFSNQLKKHDGTGWQTITILPGVPEVFTLDSTNSLWVTIQGGGIVRTDGDTIFEEYNMSNSLIPSNTVRDVEIGPDSTIWMATSAGLVNFDGIFWTVYNSSNSIMSSDIVLTIEFDSNWNLWFTSSGTQGIIRLKGGIMKLYNSTTSNCYPGWTPGELHADRKGNIWFTAIFSPFGTYKDMWRFSDTEREVWTYTGYHIVYDTTCTTISSTMGASPLNYFEYLRIYIDKQDNVWPAGLVPSSRPDSKLFKFDGATWETYHDSTSSIPQNYVTAMAQHPFTGNIWVETAYNSSGQRALTEYICPTILLDVEENELEKSQVSVFPNPISHVATIQLEGIPNQQVELKVINSSGQIVATSHFVSQDAYSFDASALSPGFYFLQFEMEDHSVEWAKIIKVNE